MILNHERRTVSEWRDGRESLCPECGGRLVARRGDVVVWHWAHRPAARGRASCPFEESRWHLRWKDVYRAFAGWDIEVPVAAGGLRYRADAMNRSAGKVREFVHSLSPYYVEKHRALSKSGYDVRWIMDGEAFASGRRKEVARGGIRRLLKPSAFLLHRDVGGVLVHFEGGLWREWRHDIWFPVSGGVARELVRRFGAAGRAGTGPREKPAMPPGNGGAADGRDGGRGDGADGADGADGRRPDA